jgi:4-nitrophenyl phosphatase
MDFSRIKAVVLDMDGVLWRGDQPLPGLKDFFQFLTDRGIRFSLATNNSRRTQIEYVAKLARFGVEHVKESHIMTSGIATASYMQTVYPPHSLVYVIGGSGLRFELQKAGFVLGDENVRAVVVGIDLEFNYLKAKMATRLLREGADFIATNADRTLPLEDGLAPGAGSLVALLQTASDRHPLVIGKPNRAMFEAVLRQMGSLAEETLMIGDRLNTDIEGAYHAGLKTALVLTGVSTREEAAAYPVKPNAIFENLPDLMAQWKSSR